MWFHGMVKISLQQTAGLDVKRSLSTLFFLGAVYRFDRQINKLMFDRSLPDLPLDDNTHSNFGNTMKCIL